MKKFLTIIIAITMMVSAVACGTNKEETNDTQAFEPVIKVLRNYDGVYAHRYAEENGVNLGGSESIGFVTYEGNRHVSVTIEWINEDGGYYRITKVANKVGEN